MKVIRDKHGTPFSKWAPAEKFEHILRGTGVYEYVEKEVEFDAKRKWRFDFAWPSKRVAVEIDGFGYGHQAQQQMAADNEKANRAAELGWVIFRYNSRQLGSKAGVEAAVEQVEAFLCCAK